MTRIELLEKMDANEGDGKLIELFPWYILPLRLLPEYSTLKGTDTDKYVGKTEHLNTIAKIFIKNS